MEHPIRTWRQEENITLATLASEVGVSASHLSEVERGLNNPSLALIRRLSERTEVPLMEIAQFHIGAAS